MRQTSISVLVLVSWLALASLPARAQDADLATRAEALHLDSSPGWRSLVETRERLLGGAKSQADRDAFFLSAAGRRDARAELRATVQVLFGPDAGAAVAARCRFPARDRWLRQQLSLPRSTALEDCPDLRAWHDSLKADTIYLDFASSFLESPSSMFGHSFLRLQPEGMAPLLTPTLNYAADSRHDDGIVRFIARGLFGGYPGVADQLPYFRRIRAYGDDEGRDLWEYRLLLTPSEIELLLLHLWEVKDGAFDYWFLDENCSYRTLALIAAARGDPSLLDPFVESAIPVETLKVLHEHGLLGPPTYRPAASTALDWHTRDFSPEQLAWVDDLARGRMAPADLPAMDEDTRTRVLDAAADYAGILIGRDRVPVRDRDRIVHGLLEARMAATATRQRDPPPVPARPEQSHDARVFSMGVTRSDGDIQGADVELAGFEHRLVDPLPGYVRGAAVTVLATHLAWQRHGDLKLERFDLVRATSRIPATRLFDRPAWSLHAALERKDVEDDRPLLGSAGFALGRAMRTPLGVLALTGGLDVDGGNGLDHGIGLEGGLHADLTRQFDAFAYELFWERARYLAGENSLRDAWGARTGIALDRNVALWFEWRRSGAEEDDSAFRASLRTFF